MAKEGDFNLVIELKAIDEFDSLRSALTLADKLLEFFFLVLKTLFVLRMINFFNAVEQFDYFQNEQTNLSL